MTDQSNDTPVLDLLETMTTDSIEATNLDARTLLLVRFATLVAIDAAPASYLMHLAVGSDMGLDAQSARDVLTAIAPLVGTARVISALGKVGRALGIALDMLETAEAESQAEQQQKAA
jgi:4-carboxymuconolactone decarboxylase